MELKMFNATVILYLIATVAYFAYIGFQKKTLWLIGISSAALGCIAETIGLLLRWYTAGWDHPPFTNMYESLVFFAWGIVVVYLVIELKYKVRIAGGFVIPLAFAAMGLASLTPDKSISPLVPALQSVWLHIHVATASIGYAAFLVAFGLSMLFLIRDKLPMTKIFAATSVINVAGLLALTKGQGLFMRYRLNAVERIGDAVQKIYIPGTDPPEFEQINMPILGILTLVTVLAFVVAAFINSQAESDESGKAKGKAVGVFYSAFGLLSALTAWQVIEFVNNPNVSIKVNPYSFAMLVSLWFFTALLAVINQVHSRFNSMLPEPRSLDDMAYRAIMVAFPIMTLIILTGAVWANQAWGRYWGWDPKETASLVTWIIYLLYLHTRITKGWTGRRTAYIAIIGFVSVVFTFLGVNLLLSGLHAYAKG